MSARSKRRKAKERTSILKRLRSHKVEVVVKNGGVHLIVFDRFDFWPGSGLFIDRNTQERGSGIDALLAKLRELKLLGERRWE